MNAIDFVRGLYESSHGADQDFIKQLFQVVGQNLSQMWSEGASVPIKTKSPVCKPVGWCISSAYCPPSPYRLVNSHPSTSNAVSWE